MKSFLPLSAASVGIFGFFAVSTLATPTASMSPTATPECPPLTGPNRPMAGNCLTTFDLDNPQLNTATLAVALGSTVTRIEQKLVPQAQHGGKSGAFQHSITVHLAPVTGPPCHVKLRMKMKAGGNSWAMLAEAAFARDYAERLDSLVPRYHCASTWCPNGESICDNGEAVLISEDMRSERNPRDDIKKIWFSKCGDGTTPLSAEPVICRAFAEKSHTLAMKAYARLHARLWYPSHSAATDDAESHPYIWQWNLDSDWGYKWAWENTMASYEFQAGRNDVRNALDEQDPSGNLKRWVDASVALIDWDEHLAGIGNTPLTLVQSDAHAAQVMVPTKLITDPHNADISESGAAQLLDFGSMAAGPGIADVGTYLVSIAVNYIGEAEDQGEAWIANETLIRTYCFELLEELDRAAKRPSSYSQEVCENSYRTIGAAAVLQRALWFQNSEGDSWLPRIARSLHAFYQKFQPRPVMPLLQFNGSFLPPPAFSSRCWLWLGKKAAGICSGLNCSWRAPVTRTEDS